MDINSLFKDSSDEEFETVRDLPAKKKIKLLNESRAKSDAKAEAEETAEESGDNGETDYTSDSDVAE